MIPKFEISNWLGCLYNVLGQYAELRPYIFRETSAMYGAIPAVAWADLTF